MYLLLYCLESSIQSNTISFSSIDLSISLGDGLTFSEIIVGAGEDDAILSKNWGK